jgi:hypothetical protein
MHQGIYLQCDFALAGSGAGQFFYDCEKRGNDSGDE